MCTAKEHVTIGYHTAAHKISLYGFEIMPLQSELQGSSMDFLPPFPHTHTLLRLNTDILFGHRYGLRTVLVFSGVTQRGDLPPASQEQLPEFICDSIASLLTCRS